MSVDIYHSRRTKYEKCAYYTDKPDRDLAEWVLKHKPAGYIYSQPVNNRLQEGNQVNNVMLFDKDSMCLWTSDECDDLTKGCIILYRGHPWIVDNITKELHLKQSEFGENHYDSYIYIRR